MNLSEKYNAAARSAFFAGIDAGDQDQLVAWVQTNCSYAPEHEFYIVLGVGCELAKIQNRAGKPAQIK